MTDFPHIKFVTIRGIANDLASESMVAYWDGGHRDFMARQIVAHFDEMAPLVEALRASMGTEQSEAA